MSRRCRVLVALVGMGCSALVALPPTMSFAAGDATVLAGNGMRLAAPSPDGEAAVGAWLGDHVAGAAMLSGGQEVFVDGSGAIRSVDDNGKLTTLVAAGTNGLVAPGHVTALPDGSALVADAPANRVWRVTLAGAVSPFAGDGTTTYGVEGAQASAVGLQAPRDAEVTADGAVLIADSGAGAIRRVATDGTITTLTPSVPLIGAPADLAITDTGAVLVADNGAVQQIAPDLTVTTLMSSGAAPVVGWSAAGPWFALTKQAGLVVRATDGALQAVTAIGPVATSTPAELATGPGASVTVAASNYVATVADAGLVAETAPATDFTATPGAQVVTLRWTPSPTSVAIIGKPGNTPPTDLNDGSVVTGSHNMSVSFSGSSIYRVGADVLAADQPYSFAIFTASCVTISPSACLQQWSPAATATATPTADTTAPGPPTSLSSRAGKTSLFLGWRNPGDEDFDRLVLRMNAGDVPPQSPTEGTDVLLANPTTVNATVTNLDASGDYSFTLFASDLHGNTSQASWPALHVDQTPPGLPTAVNVTDLHFAMRLGWTNPADADYAGMAITVKDGDAVPQSPTDGRIDDLSNLATSEQFNNTVEGSRITVALWPHDQAGNYVISPLVVPIDTPVRDHTPPGAATLMASGGVDGVTVRITNPVASDFSHSDIYWRKCNCDILSLTGPPAYSGTAASVHLPLNAGVGTYALVALAYDTSGNVSWGQTIVVSSSSVKLTSTPAVSGLTTTITAAVTPAAATGTVTLERRAPGATTWSAVATTSTPSNRKATFSVKPLTTTDYRVTYSNGMGWLGSRASLSLPVAQRVTIAASRSSAPHGTRILLSGQVYPGAAGGGYVYLQQLVGSTWKTVGHVTLPRGGKLGFTVRPMTRGVYKYRFYRPAVATNTAGYSSAKSLTIS